MTPGLVNAHHHLLQTAFRTLPGTRGVPMREWLPRMAQAYASVGVTPATAGVAARVGLAESLLCGVTTVADHHLTWPAGLPVADTVGIAQATAEAARDLGARLVFVRGSARDDPGWAAESADAVAEALVPGFGGVSDDGMLQVAVGPAGVHSDAPETFARLGEVARRRGLRRRTQANEQVDVEVAAERYGARPLALLEEWGWLGPDVTLAHLCDGDRRRDRAGGGDGHVGHARPRVRRADGLGGRAGGPAARGRGTRRAGDEWRRQQRRRSPPGRRAAGDAGVGSGRGRSCPR